MILVGRVRVLKGVTRTELSKRTGIALSHLQSIENHTVVPSITVICKIAKALNVRPEKLFTCDD